MSVELFGAEVAPYAAVACVISFMITGHRSAYPSQVLAVKKSSSIAVEVGGEMSGMKPGVEYRDRSIVGVLRQLIKKDSNKDGP